MSVDGDDLDRSVASRSVGCVGVGRELDLNLRELFSACALDAVELRSRHGERDGVVRCGGGVVGVGQRDDHSLRRARQGVTS